MGIVYNELSMSQKEEVCKLLGRNIFDIKLAKQAIDLTDQEFGDWKVIGYAGDKKWVCLCNCGYIKLIYGYELRSGKSKSCGHATNLKNTRLNKFMDFRKSATADLMAIIHNCGKFSIDIGCYILEGTVLDIYIDEAKLGIMLHNSNIENYKTQHKNIKQKLSLIAFKKHIHVIHIFDYEWYNDNKRDIINRLLINRLSTTKTIIYARECTIREISLNMHRDIEESNHLQGHANADIKYGAFFNNELIGVMTFGKPRFAKDVDYELIRLCWKSGVNVVGGSERMFKHFIDEYKPHSVLSYCDIGKFAGNVYTRLGFKLDPAKPIIEPNYVWVKLDTLEALPRYKTQKHKLLAKGLGTEEDTENTIMERLGYVKVYDCGNARFVWKDSGTTKLVGL